MDQLNSRVIRVLKQRYPMDYVPVLKDIVADEVDFYAHTILRDGIEDGIWYKVGKEVGDFEKEMEIPIFGSCQGGRRVVEKSLKYDPDDEWYLWKINHDHVRFGILPEKLRDIVEPGSVFSYREIVNRIKYGYYKWNSPAYFSLRRRPHPDTDSYVKRETDESTDYLHFLGEDVVRRIRISSRGDVKIEEGHPLPLPKFWEANWGIDEFITEKELKDAWDQYAE